MNEIVYAADIDNYELYYVNRKAREILGVNSVEEVKGKQCYEVLHGRSEPCPYCTNKSLRTGQFEEWKRYNPEQNKTYMLKDTLITENGHHYRVEMAIDISEQVHQKELLHGYETNEAMVNEGLRLAMQEEIPDRELSILMEYLGRQMHSDRAYIFERNPDDTYSNTYEWCAEGVVPEIENLQHLQTETVKIWVDRFEKSQNILIRRLEDIETVDPLMYDYLKPQNIHSLVVSPLTNKDRIIGFFGVDNPPEGMLENVSVSLQILGHFISSMLRRRNLMNRLENLSFYDQLTGCGNRHRMNEVIASLKPDESIGIVYADVTGLKRVNDELGHKAGDQLLSRACKCLECVFSNDTIFRMGGDEFLVLCAGCTEEQLNEWVERLKDELKRHDLVLALGSVWRPTCTENMDKLLAIADQRMYENKNAYYAHLYATKGIDRRR
jgi:diguanylate cyclase (GGDEF)-like protein